MYEVIIWINILGYLWKPNWSSDLQINKCLSPPFPSYVYCLTCILTSLQPILVTSTRVQMWLYNADQQLQQNDHCIIVKLTPKPPKIGADVNDDKIAIIEKSKCKWDSVKKQKWKIDVQVLCRKKTSPKPTCPHWSNVIT